MKQEKWDKLHKELDNALQSAFEVSKFEVSKQFTAVEWLENEFQEMCKDFGGVHSDFIVKFDQAKAKERSQKAEEYLKGFKDGKEYQIKLDELTFKSE